MKTCTACLTPKPESEFHANGAHLRPECKPCWIAKVRTANDADFEFVRRSMQLPLPLFQLLADRAKKRGEPKWRTLRAALESLEETG